MAIRTEEEERAKVRGIPNLPFTAADVGAGIRQNAYSGLVGVNNFVRNTSPVREIYGSAGMVSDFARGIFGGRSQPAVAQASPLGLRAPNLMAAHNAAQTSAAALPPVEKPTGIRTQTVQPSTTPAAAVAAQPGAPAGMRFRSAQDSSDYQKYIGTGMSSDPSPSVHRAMLQDPATGKYSFQEIQNGTDTPPALQTPFVSAKAFRQITGYDRDRNPIYSTGADEMSAANAGIADYNKSLMDGYTQRNTQWADMVGGVPKDIADAAKTRAETAEIPLEGTSARGLRSATAAAQGESKNKPILREIDVPTGVPNALGERPTVRKLVSVNPETMEVTELKLGGGATAKSLYTQLAADKKSVVDKHFAGRADVTPTEVAEFIKNLK